MTVNVLNCVNEKYVVHCGPVWLAILDHLGAESSHRDVHFYVYFDGPADSSHLVRLREFVRQYASLHPGTSVAMTVQLATDLSAIKEHAASSQWPDIALGRLFVARILPADAARVLYLDVDLAILGDIGALYDTDLGGAVCGAVRNDCFRVDYFNSGVLLLDLARWRADQFERRLLESQHLLASTLIFPDQDVLNAVVKGPDVHWLSPKWNCFVSHYLVCSHRVHCAAPSCIGADIDRVAGERKIVHAMGTNKMWDQPWSTAYAGPHSRYHSYSRMERRVAQYARGGPEQTLAVPPELGHVVLSFKYMARKMLSWGVRLPTLMAAVKRMGPTVRSATVGRPPFVSVASDEEMCLRELVHLVFDATDAGLYRDEVLAELEHFAPHVSWQETEVWRSDDGESARPADVTIQLGRGCFTAAVPTEDIPADGEFMIDQIHAQPGTADVTRVQTGAKKSVPLSRLRPLVISRPQLDLEAPSVALVRGKLEYTYNARMIKWQDK